MQELSVMPLPLAMGLDLVMNKPERVRLVDLNLTAKQMARAARRPNTKG